MRLGRRESPCTTVVGIAEDIYQDTLTDVRRYQYYLPLEQAGGPDGTGLVLRLRTDPVQAAEEVRRALQAVMPGDSYVSVQPMGVLVERAQSSWRLGATMFVAFGALALLVAAIGLYGVISYSIAQRMHELAVRVALGASRRDVGRLVFIPALRFALIGCVLGTGVAVLLRGRLEPLLFRQSAGDPLVYAGVAVVMLMVAALASLGPAARAARADPLEALRTE
jgi:ABC-type antimicrobial peptide transport system permease subunit